MRKTIYEAPETEVVLIQCELSNLQGGSLIVNEDNNQTPLDEGDDDF